MKDITIVKYNKLSSKNKENYRPTYKRRKIIVKDICDECGSVNEYESFKSYGKPISYHRVDYFDLIREDIDRALKQSIDSMAEFLKIDTKDIKLK